MEGLKKYNNLLAEITSHSVTRQECKVTWTEKRLQKDLQSVLERVSWCHHVCEKLPHRLVLLLCLVFLKAPHI